MIERGDRTVLDEPFSARYYFSRERRSSRFDESEPDATGPAVLEQIRTAAEEAPVFVKDMAYHATGLLSASFLANFTNTFLIREPAATLASLARKWPDFTAEEAGFEAMGAAFDLVVRGHDAPVVMDADELTADPESMVAAWCARVGIPFVAEALSWSPGMVPQWMRWQDWYTGVAESSGFRKPAAADQGSRGHLQPAEAETPADALVPVEVLSHAQVVYDRLHAVRIRP